MGVFERNATKNATVENHVQVYVRTLRYYPTHQHSIEIPQLMGVSWEEKLTQFSTRQIL